MYRLTLLRYLFSVFKRKTWRKELCNGTGDELTVGRGQDICFLTKEGHVIARVRFQISIPTLLIMYVSKSVQCNTKQTSHATGSHHSVKPTAANLTTILKTAILNTVLSEKELEQFGTESQKKCSKRLKGLKGEKVVGEVRLCRTATRTIRSSGV